MVSDEVNAGCRGLSICSCFWLKSFQEEIDEPLPPATFTLFTIQKEMEKKTTKERMNFTESEQTEKLRSEKEINGKTQEKQIAKVVVATCIDLHCLIYQDKR